MSLKKLLRISISGSLIGYLIYLVDFSGTLQRIGTIDLSVVWLAVILLMAQVGLSTFKWQLLLNARRIHMRFLFLFGTYLKGNFVSLFLPTSFGGDVYRVVSLNQESGNLGDSTASVLFDRITGLFALVSIGILAYIALPDMPHKWALLSLYLLGLAAFLVVTSGFFLERLYRFVPSRLSKVLLPLQTFNHFRRIPRLMLAVLAISFLFQFNIVVVNKIFCMALDIDIPFSILLAIVPVIYLTEVLPISVNGIGVRDSAFVFFFSYLGYPAEEGLAVALLVLLFRYIMGSIGGVVFVTEALFQKMKSA